VSCAICASSWPCTLEETGGTLISPGSPLNPRLRGSQNFHKKTSRNSSKLPFFPTGALRCTCRAPRRAFTPPMQPENLLRYRCPKNRAPQRELRTANTTKTTEEGRRGREEESPRNRSRGVTSPRARVQGLWCLCDVSTGAGVDGVPHGCTFGPARSLTGGPVSTAGGRSLAGRGLPCCAGVLHVSQVVALVRWWCSRPTTTL
jgi:hypothetical protein